MASQKVFCSMQTSQVEKKYQEFGMYQSRNLAHEEKNGIRRPS